MIAYHKKTIHPYCVYLSADELCDVVNEIDDALFFLPNNAHPVLLTLREKLSKVHGTRVGNRA